MVAWNSVQGAVRVRIGSSFVLAALAVIAVGCGSSSPTTHPAAAKPQPIRGVPPKPGAVSARAAGLKKLAVVPMHAAFAPRITGVDGVPITQAIPAIAGDINGFWSGEFANSNVAYPQGEQEILIQSTSVQDPCTGAVIAPTDPAAYCAPSGGGQVGPATFYWTVPWMQHALDTDAGRVNLTFDIAEFWSLYVQDLEGTTRSLNTGTITKAQYAEQNACLTGVYVRSLATRQLIEKGDTQTANSWVAALSASADGITAPDVTSAQLQQGFLAGFQTGSPNSCAATSPAGGTG